MPISAALCGTKTTLPFGKRTPPAYPPVVAGPSVNVFGFEL